jgi:hypothetical protein
MGEVCQWEIKRHGGVTLRERATDPNLAVGELKLLALACE